MRNQTSNFLAFNQPLETATAAAAAASPDSSRLTMNEQTLSEGPPPPLLLVGPTREAPPTNHHAAPARRVPACDDSRRSLRARIKNKTWLGPAVSYSQTAARSGRKRKDCCRRGRSALFPASPPRRASLTSSLHCTVLFLRNYF